MDQSIGKPFLRSCPDKRDRTRLTVLSRLNRLESQSIKMDSKLDRILLILSKLASCSINNQKPPSIPRSDLCSNHGIYHNRSNPQQAQAQICDHGATSSQSLHPNSSGKLMRSSSFSTSQIPQSGDKDKTNVLNNFLKQKVFRSQSTKVPKKNLLSPDSKYDRNNEKSIRQEHAPIVEPSPHNYFRNNEHSPCACTSLALSTMNLEKCIAAFIPALSSPPSLNSSMYTPSPEFLSSPEFCDVKGPQRVMSSINICAPVSPPLPTLPQPSTIPATLLESSNQDEYSLDVPNINIEPDIADIMRRRNTPSFVFP